MEPELDEKAVRASGALGADDKNQKNVQANREVLDESHFREVAERSRIKYLGRSCHRLQATPSTFAYYRWIGCLQKLRYEGSDLPS